MAEKKLEKVSIVPDENHQGYRLALSWLTGGSGREAELLPQLHATEAEAAEQARADYGVEPEPRDHSVDRRP